MEVPLSLIADYRLNSIDNWQSRGGSLSLHQGRIQLLSTGASGTAEMLAAA
jgi:hypothetical protein